MICRLVVSAQCRRALSTPGELRMAASMGVPVPRPSIDRWGRPGRFNHRRGIRIAYGNASSPSRSSSVRRCMGQRACGSRDPAHAFSASGSDAAIPTEAMSWNYPRRFHSLRTAPREPLRAIQANFLRARPRDRSPRRPDQRPVSRRLLLANAARRSFDMADGIRPRAARRLSRA